jgi:hypothetical protein
MLHCVLTPGQSIYIPCNWHHATLNIGETLAAGGQQADGSAAATDGGLTCAADADATANTQFQQATASITTAIALPEQDVEERAMAFAAGEVLLQQMLAETPLRLDGWLWRLHAHAARGDTKAETGIANDAASAFEAGVAEGVLTPLRATIKLVAILRQLMHDKPRVQGMRALLRRARAMASKDNAGKHTPELHWLAARILSQV